MNGLPTAVRRRLPGWRSDSPEAFALDGRRSGARTLVACVGDSITAGQASANYVDRLKRRWEPAGFQFINAGINGNLAYNVAQRLDAVIACRPDVVTLLVGTNDVNSQFGEKTAQRYHKRQQLPIAPTRDWYAENLGVILDRLAAETDARVVVLDLPMLGEDLASRMNGLIGEYSAALGEVAAQRAVPVLPLHAGLVELLPAGEVPPPYEGDFTLIVKAVVSHQLLGRSWDEVSRRNGLAVLTDQIHLNDRAAAVVADLISGVLKDQEAPKQ